MTERFPRYDMYCPHCHTKLDFVSIEDTGNKKEKFATTADDIIGEFYGN